MDKGAPAGSLTSELCRAEPSNAFELHEDLQARQIKRDASPGFQAAARNV